MHLIRFVIVFMRTDELNDGQWQIPLVWERISNQRYSQFMSG